MSGHVGVYLIGFAAFNANPIKNSHNTVVTATYLSNFWETSVYKDKVMSSYEIKLKHHELVAEGTMAFHFERPANFKFKAGQAWHHTDFSN